MLTVTTTQGTTSQDCKTLVITDTTGTGSTGYLAPNYVVGDVAELVFDCIPPNESVYTEPYVLTGSDAEDIMNGTSNLGVTSQVLNPTLTTNSPLVDGVYYGRYVPYWLAASTISVTAGSASATLSTTAAVAPYAGVDRMKIDGEYYGVEVSGTAVTLDRLYIGTTNATQAWYAGFESPIILKQACNAERCLALKRANLYTTNCECSDIEKREATNRQFDLDNANAMFTNGNYTQFQSVMNQLTNYCNDTNNGCNCH